MGSEIRVLPGSSTARPFSQPFCLRFPSTSAKEGERHRRAERVKAFLTLTRSMGTQEGDFSSVVVAHSSEQ